MASWRLYYLKDSDNVAKKASLSVGFPSDYPLRDQEDTTFPIQNAQTLPVSKPARVKNDTPTNGNAAYGMVINMTFQGPTSVDFVALIGHNISSSATITIYGGTSFPASSSLGTMTWRKGTAFKAFSSGQSYQYFKISVLDDSNPDGFLQLGYLMAGTLSTLTYGQFEYSFTDIYETSKVTSEIGVPVGDSVWNGDQELSLSFRNRTVAECTTLKSAFISLSGSGNPVFLIPNAAENDGLFGRIRDSFNRDYVPAGSSGRVNFSLTARSENYGRAAVTELPRAGVFEDVSEWTFARAATGYYKNSKLQLVQAASGELRSEHYYDYGKPCILIDAGAYNRLLYSEDMSALNWTKTNLNVSTDAIDEPKASPSTTADKIYEDSNTGVHSIKQSIAGSLQTDNYPYAVAVFLKAAERTKVKVYVIDKAGTTYSAIVDLSAGTIGSYSDSAKINGYLEPYYDGWYRVHFNCITVGTGATTPYVEISLLDASDNESYTGDGASGVYIWGVQLNPNVGTASSYCATGAAVATTTADQFYKSISLKQQAMTIYFSVYRSSLLSILNTERPFTIGQSTSSGDPRILYYYAATTGRIYWYFGLNVSYASDRSVYPALAAEMAAIAYGDLIELILQISPGGGIRAYVYANGNTYNDNQYFTTADEFDPVTMDRIAIGCDTYTLSSYRANHLLFNKMRMAYGVQSVEYMRSLK